MTIKNLDVRRMEEGIGASDIETITGNPFSSSAVGRNEVEPGDEAIIGNEDGYDVSNATGLRLWIDVIVDEAIDSFVELLIIPMAANPGPSDKPVPKIPGDVDANSFEPFVIVLPDPAGPLVTRSGALRFEESQRISVTYPRNSLQVRFATRKDGASPSDSAIALAVQAVHDEGGE